MAEIYKAAEVTTQTAPAIIDDKGNVVLIESALAKIMNDLDEIKTQLLGKK